MQIVLSDSQHDLVKRKLTILIHNPYLFLPHALTSMEAAYCLHLSLESANYNITQMAFQSYQE